jgi:hypothetical protein
MTTDRPARVVLLASRLLADEDTAWGRAMLGELPSVTGRSARWRFAVGCLRTSLLAPVRRVGIAPAVCLLALADAAVVAIALVRYPGLRSGAAAWWSPPSGRASAWPCRRGRTDSPGR